MCRAGSRASPTDPERPQTLTRRDAEWRAARDRAAAEAAERRAELEGRVREAEQAASTAARKAVDAAARAETSDVALQRVRAACLLLARGCAAAVRARIERTPPRTGEHHWSSGVVS